MYKREKITLDLCREYCEKKNEKTLRKHVPIVEKRYKVCSGSKNYILV